MQTKWGLFERYGVELEYMICDKTTLDVRPIADQLIHRLAGAYVNEVDAGAISYSNELALHVIELKTSEPVPDLQGVDRLFQHHVEELNKILDGFNAFLMPTGMHPWMNPYTEMKLWEHEQNPIYEAYHRIFDCRGHGWANLQSVHLNLSFTTDEELKALHSAIRWLLPIMPALSASSPICDMRVTGFLDTRLEVYRHNQKKVPSIAGQVIPEPIASTEDYYKTILHPIWADIAPFDQENILQEEWLNSRGAIVRFDRNAVEIRVLDTQECPEMDFLVLRYIVDVLKRLSTRVQKGELSYNLLDTNDLAEIFVRCVKEGERTLVAHPEYLALFGFSQPLTAGDMWKRLVQDNSLILREGPLARRILCSWNDAQGDLQKKEVYRTLCACLGKGVPYGSHATTLAHHL